MAGCRTKYRSQVLWFVLWNEPQRIASVISHHHQHHARVVVAPYEDSTFTLLEHVHRQLVVLHFSGSFALGSADRQRIP
jgi:uncharacterized protein YjaZ